MYKVLIPFIDAVTGIAYKVGDIVAFDADRAKEILANGNFIEVYVDTGGAGGGSWNDLKDKPFGETVTYSDTLTWDGVVGDKAVVELVPEILNLVKVSDVIFAKEDLVGGIKFSMNMVGEVETLEYSYEEIMSDEEVIFKDDGYISLSFILVIPNDNYVGDDGLSVSEKGVYFMQNIQANMYASSLTINGYKGFETKTVTTIDSKYLPEALQFGEKEIELLNSTYEFVYDENMGGAFYDFSNDAIKVGSGGTILKIVWDGTEYECVSEFIYGMEVWGNLFGDSSEPFAIAVQTDGNMQIMSMPSSTNETHTIKITMKTVEKIDIDYIPTGRLVYVRGADNDHYMYSDYDCQNKLTYNDFASAIDGLNVVINVPISSNYYKAIASYPVVVGNEESAMCIDFYYGDKFRRFFTAEYTG